MSRSTMSFQLLTICELVLLSTYELKIALSALSLHLKPPFFSLKNDQEYRKKQIEFDQYANLLFAVITNWK